MAVGLRSNLRQNEKASRVERSQATSESKLASAGASAGAHASEARSDFRSACSKFALKSSCAASHRGDPDALSAVLSFLHEAAASEEATDKEDSEDNEEDATTFPGLRFLLLAFFSVSLCRDAEGESDAAAVFIPLRESPLRCAISLKEKESGTTRQRGRHR